jgi:hypothetical protein
VATGGPYVGLAAFCERVLVEKDEVISLVRVIDRITAVRPASVFGDQMPPVTHPLWMVISLRPDRARGRHPIKVEVEKPSTERVQIFDGSVLFEAEDRSVNVLLNVGGLAFELEGLYWFDVSLGTELLSRVPLRINYQPV